MSLAYISQQVTIYVGWFFVIAGIGGNGLNILIFTSVRNYRQTPCTFYFLITSIDNIVVLIVSVISRIFIAGYQIDLTLTSTFWCKLRAYLINVLTLISFTYSCLASIDQFLVTSRNANVRRFSNIKWAHRMMFIVIIVWCLHGIPQILFYDISSITQTCRIINASYSIYASIYVLSLTCIIPIVVMIVFGYLTYRNIHLTRVIRAEQQADHQLVRMTLIQVILVVISITPYGINNVYGLITSTISKDLDRLTKESFISTILSLFTYVNYIGTCYMFLISSRRFRRQMDAHLNVLEASQVILYHLMKEYTNNGFYLTAHPMTFGNHVQKMIPAQTGGTHGHRRIL
ncbi:unnamed protein product [Adineta steineri]|uniref:G-protein coupled receptors family 1 profile domain-containing protein n=1 Tax=Adineta steineri TaxID=433720 RepID=A0A819YSY7_9BILA|nr:unnamed protein product [Adineta steineri]